MPLRNDDPMNDGREEIGLSGGDLGRENRIQKTFSILNTKIEVMLDMSKVKVVANKCIVRVNKESLNNIITKSDADDE